MNKSLGGAGEVRGKRRAKQACEAERASEREQASAGSRTLTRTFSAARQWKWILFGKSS